MSRRITIISLVVLVAASIAVAGDAPWFDMENCAMCKNLYKNPELVQNMLWEQYGISNGIISVTTVREEYIDDYRTAHADMKKVSEKLQKGEKLDMCASCNALGACMAKGVAQEYVETKTGDVWLITSDNAEVVAELQAWAKRNTEEMAKMMSEKTKG
jgi:hypothetical protein